MNLGDLNTIGFGSKSLMDDDGNRFFVIVKAQYCLKMISIVEYCWIEKSWTLKTGGLLEWVLLQFNRYYNTTLGIQNYLNPIPYTKTDWLTDWLTDREEIVSHSTDIKLRQSEATKGVNQSCLLTPVSILREGIYIEYYDCTEFYRLKSWRISVFQFILSIYIK